MTIPVALIPGAGGAAWYWHLVEPELRARGYDAFAVELPAADESKHLTDYADAVVAAVGERRTVALVAQSMGGFTAPLVWQRVPAAAVVLVNAMIPDPGETPGAWWGNVGSAEARTAAAHASGYSPDFDLDTYFLHDVPAELAAVMRATDKPQADAPFGDVCEFDAWPDVPIHVVTGRDDRFFPLALQQRVARATGRRARGRRRRSPGSAEQAGRTRRRDRALPDPQRSVNRSNAGITAVMRGCSRSRPPSFGGVRACSGAQLDPDPARRSRSSPPVWQSARP